MTVHKFGENGDVPNGTYEVIWTPGTTPYPGFLQTADFVRIKSGGNAADDSAGLGARTVVVIGLDEQWNPLTQTLTTAGASVSAASDKKFIRVFRAYVDTAGAFNVANTGAITIETTTGIVMAVIAAGMGQTQMAIYSVRADYTALLHSISISTGSVKFVNVRVFQCYSQDADAAPFGAKRLMMQLYEVVDFYETFESFPILEEKTDIWIEAAGAGGVSASVSARFDLHLVSTQ